MTVMTAVTEQVRAFAGWPGTTCVLHLDGALKALRDPSSYYIQSYYARAMIPVRLYLQQFGIALGLPLRHRSGIG